MSEEDSEPKGEQKRSGYWRRLKKKWNRQGVVEIDLDHGRYDMLQCIRQGLNDLLTNHPELGPKDELTADDYGHVLQTAITAPNGKIFQFASYASPVFATIRQATGLLEADFLNSICPEDKPYLEFISNSKSGQCFYLSNDKAYFMKTDKKVAIDFLLNILGDYLDHFLSYPHSLIVKYLGLFSVQVDGEPRKYFYIMQSIFYPDERIERRYDVKGALAGRYQKPVDETEGPVLHILKDQNFLDETIDVGSQRGWLVKQIGLDARFMKSLGVQDYSMLVAYQALHQDEKTQDLGDIVQRVQTSIPQPKTKKDNRPTELLDMKKILALKDDTSLVPEVRISDHDKETTNGNDIEFTVSATEVAIDPESLDSPDANQNNNSNVQDRLERKRPLLGMGHALSFIRRQDSDSQGLQNRRLLPKLSRPLHIIDGPENRYFLGIIDFFTPYNCRQKVGRVLKSIKFCCGDHSTIPPGPYADRFVAFLEDHVQ